MKLFIAVVIATCMSAAAMADSIDFSFFDTSSSATWTWALGTAGLTANANSAKVGLLGWPQQIPLNGDVLVSFTSGPNVGGKGTYPFGAGGSIVIDGCLPNQGPNCATVPLFSGTFTDGELGHAGLNNFSFDGPDVTGTINPELAAFFGFQTSNVVGSLDAILVCAGKCESGLSGLIGSGDLVLSAAPGESPPPPSPEPSPLGLVGGGLLVLGVLCGTRRRSIRLQSQK